MRPECSISNALAITSSSTSSNTKNAAATPVEGFAPATISVSAPITSTALSSCQGIFTLRE